MPVTCLRVSEYSSAEERKGLSEMKSLLFALGLALCCFVQAGQDQLFADIDHSQISGSMIATALITDCQRMEKMLQNMKSFYITFEQISKDELTMTMDMFTPHGCKAMRPVLKREEEGFTTTCGKGGKKIVEYVNLNQNSMYTSVNVIGKHGQCKVATLTVKSLGDTEPSIEDFKAFAARVGLENGRFYRLPTTDMCSKST